MIGLDNYHGPRKCLDEKARRRLVQTYLDGQARARANPRHPSEPRLEALPISMRELAEAYGITPRTGWRYVAEARAATVDPRSSGPQRPAQPTPTITEAGRTRPKPPR